MNPSISALKTLKDITEKQKITGSVFDAMEAAEELLEKGMGQTAQRLVENIDGAPRPVDEISKYILEAGGKRIRPALCLLSAKAFDNNATPVDLAVTAELMHNATLLHDDVIDDADTRRGSDAVRKVWSNALSILGGDYLLMRCVDIMSDFDGVYMKLFVDTLRALVEGEIVQLGLREQLGCTEQDYYTIIKGKTSSLFSFATRTGAMSAGAPDSESLALGEFGANVGIAFQLVDDSLDFAEKNEDLGKDLLLDISQGKMTLPVIWARKQAPEISTALEELVAGIDHEKNVSAISRLVRETGAIDQVILEARNRTEMAVDAIDSVESGDSKVLDVLKQLALALVSRKL